MTKDKYQVLLYYKYVDIDNPVRLMRQQKTLCEKLNLKGRIIIAKEGINGTLEGKTSDTEKYIKDLLSKDEFKGIDIKKSEGTGEAFPKLSVKVRDEIVTAGLPDLNPNSVTGKYISADELHQWFEDKKEFYVVDMRNDYEYISGFFEGTIFSEFNNFRDLKSISPKLAHLKDKTIVTVCTGGVRCEKASGFLVTEGFNDVYQLKDGIQTYMERYPNQHFKGKLYVFDKRLTIGFNVDDPAHEVVGKCVHCETASDKYVNCANNACHKHYICCDNCKDKETGQAFCDENCKAKFFKEASKEAQFQQQP